MATPHNFYGVAAHSRLGDGTAQTAVISSDAYDRATNQAGEDNIELQLGTAAVTLDASNFYTITLQESATSTPADFTDVAAADMDIISVNADTLTQATASHAVNTAELDDDVVILRYTGNLRYIRAQITGTGTLGAGMAVMFSGRGMNPKVMPSVGDIGDNA